MDIFDDAVFSEIPGLGLFKTFIVVLGNIMNV